MLSCPNPARKVKITTVELLPPTSFETCKSHMAIFLASMASATSSSLRQQPEQAEPHACAEQAVLLQLELGWYGPRCGPMPGSYLILGLCFNLPGHVPALHNLHLGESL